MLSISLLIAASFACEPPPAVDVASSASAFIEMVHPVPSTTIEVDAEGVLRFPVAVYIEGFDFTPDNIDGELVDGAGHYHIIINDDYYAAPLGLLEDVEVPGGQVQGPFAVDDVLFLMVLLVNNDHTAFEGPSTEVTVVRELTIVAADPVQ